MKIAVIGRTEILLKTAELLVEKGHEIVCVITAKAAPEYTVTEGDFFDLASRVGAQYFSGAKIERFSQQIAKANADIAVSINYSGVIPKAITDMFPLGILNAHGGDLPRYRGNACQAWALLNGEEKIGLCIHKMIGGELDSGDIIERDFMQVDENSKIGEVLAWIECRAPVLMLAAVQRLSKDKSYVFEQQSKKPEDALRCYPRQPTDGQIRWHESASSIVRLVNASGRPFQGAFCDLNGQKLTIWEAKRVIDSENFCAVPGQVVAVLEKHVDVACGEGKVRLLDVATDEFHGDPSAIIKSIRTRLR